VFRGVFPSRTSHENSRRPATRATTPLNSSTRLSGSATRGRSLARHTRRASGWRTAWAERGRWPRPSWRSPHTTSGRTSSRWFELGIPDLDILVIDDNSPDGTGAVAEELATRHPQLSVLHREGKLGLGTAHVAAMRRAIEGGYEFLVTMDADFSHHPRYLPEILARAGDNDPGAAVDEPRGECLRAPPPGAQAQGL